MLDTSAEDVFALNPAGGDTASVRACISVPSGILPASATVPGLDGDSLWLMICDVASNGIILVVRWTAIYRMICSDVYLPGSVRQIASVSR